MPVLLSLLAAVIHEAGHFLALLFCGVGLRDISFSPAGFTITHGETLSFAKENICLLAGIFMNLLFAPFGLLVGQPVFSAANLTLALLNILPIASFDGGRLLKNLLSLFLDPYPVSLLCAFLHWLFLFLLWAFGIFLLLFTGYNYSLFLTVICLFVGTVRGDG